MARKTNNHRAQQRDRLLRANVWSLRTLWTSLLKHTYRLILVTLVLGAVGGACWGGKVALDRLFYENPDFRLQEVKLNPNEAINERDFVAITGLDLNTNLFRIDIRAITRRLLSHPAIKTAAVERQTPGTLLVNVTARTPRAWIACPEGGLPATRAAGSMLVGFDEVLYPCPELQLQTAAPLPVIELSKQDAHPLEPGTKCRHPEFANCVRLVNAARDQDGHGLEWIATVRQANAWSLALTTQDATVATFGLGDHPRQLAYLHTALEHARTKGYTIATINLIPRENVPVTVTAAVPPRAIPVEEPATTPPASGTRRARDLDSLLNRN